ncbi:A-kinase anchor protein 7 isoform gamma isoform X3 [Pundamilia nyererei]|uniref:A-kinase anchor protein 7 isoform gamma isoform X3 n=1 Tax=Pundamilia nyererei TaxID=303518 RepID=A0A9Y6J6W2_9CICH|nr:PREDICTED: A-kinase anchor protein 7 isoform gamma isoform X3 [Pundamilia nyererei]
MFCSMALIYFNRCCKWSRVILSLGSKRSQRICAVNEVLLRSQHSVSVSYSQQARALRLKPPAQRFRFQVTAPSYHHLLTVCDMQPASISYGRDTTSVASDEDDEGDENLAGKEVGEEHKDLREMVMTSAQTGAVGMEVQESPADPEAASVSTPSGSNEKKTRRKLRRERKKLMKKTLKSSDTSENLLSELPFALASPTTWKALFPSQESTKRKRKRKRGDIEGRVDSEDDGDKKKKKKESQRPNYFVSIPITNTQISSAVSEVQEAVLQQDPRLAKAMIPVPTLHITLLVTHLANQEQVDLAAAVLAQVEPSLAELLGGRDLVLPFSGISHFRKEVVFVGLASGQHRHTLDSLAELLRSRFEEQGLLQGDCRGFEPHLTIMKLSRASKLRSQGIKRVDPALYSNYTDKFFGDQTVERVDLCSMLKKKQQDGYYHTETSLQLGSVSLLVA